ncbi:MAG: nickel pincer cofactor biosynthesis protein LarB [Armatimonadetes bacterium]|nr:nickel pincer cofactor biosynthesis protein LarB [Armatimonadota bacterium]
MNDDSLLQMLSRVRSGELSPEQALESLRLLPYEDLGFAKLDHHRGLRTGVPEVVFCQGKAVFHTVEIVQRLQEHSGHVLATRAVPEVFAAIRDAGIDATYHELARIVEVGERVPSAIPPDRYVLVAAAGTSDLAVAEEAAIIAEALGSPVRRLYDVGVAGIHRLLDHSRDVMEANAIVVVAGMEGALASVVGGLASAPVIACPTSVGYGASFNGLAALLTMLNSCASGVAVVNIDNGFGAGYMAHVINARTGGPA